MFYFSNCLCINALIVCRDYFAQGALVTTSPPGGTLLVLSVGGGDAGVRLVHGALVGLSGPLGTLGPAAGREVIGVAQGAAVMPPVTELRSEA
jgi:hypothetical protein